MDSRPLYRAQMVKDGRQTYGPRGGSTTRKNGRVKKTLWLNQDEADGVRKLAYDDHRSESDIIRSAIRKYLKLPD